MVDLFPELPGGGKPHPLRRPCACGSNDGMVLVKNGQNCLYCSNCRSFTGYNVPAAEMAGRPATNGEIHSRVSSSRRWRIMELQGFRCAACHDGADSGAILHVDHILPVDLREESGLTIEEINSDNNLWALCAECNIGKGTTPMEPRLFAAILRARMAWQNRLMRR